MLHLYRRGFGLSRLYDELAGLAKQTNPDQAPFSPIGTGAELRMEGEPERIGPSGLPALNKQLPVVGINTLLMTDDELKTVPIVTLPSPKSARETALV